MAAATSLVVFLLCLSVSLPAVSESQINGDVTQQVFVRNKMPCSCTKEECSCCSVLNLERINFTSKGCLKFKHDIPRNGLYLRGFLNDISIFETSISARKTPPICIPLPIPLVSICARIRDIRWEEQKLYVCANLELSIQKIPVVVIPFDCVYIGAGGIGLEKSTTVPKTITVSTEKSTTVPSTTTVSTEKSTTVPGTTTVSTEKSTTVPGTTTVSTEKSTTVPGTTTVSNQTIT